LSDADLEKIAGGNDDPDGISDDQLMEAYRNAGIGSSAHVPDAPSDEVDPHQQAMLDRDMIDRLNQSPEHLYDLARDIPGRDLPDMPDGDVGGWPDQPADDTDKPDE
jgi:hypothetical protein